MNAKIPLETEAAAMDLADRINHNSIGDGYGRLAISEGRWLIIPETTAAPYAFGVIGAWLEECRKGLSKKGIV